MPPVRLLDRKGALAPKAKKVDKKDAVIEILVKALLHAIPGCRAVYRFGSWGTSAQRPDSDRCWNLCVVVRKIIEEHASDYREFGSAVLKVPL